MLLRKEFQLKSNVECSNKLPGITYLGDYRLEDDKGKLIAEANLEKMKFRALLLYCK